MSRHAPLRRALLAAALGLGACFDDPTSPMSPTSPEPAQPDMATVEPTADGIAAAAVIDAWTSRAPMPTARDRLAAGVVANAVGTPILYAVGGTNSSSVPLAKVEAYDPATNSWTGRAGLPSARNLTNGTGTIAGRLYVSGGMLAGGSPTKSMLAYSPGTNSWSSKAAMPVASAQGVTTVINGKLYVLIGYCVGCSEGTRVRRLYRYDPAGNSWTRLADAPAAHLQGAAGAIGGKLYVAGGSGASGQVTTALHVYNPATNSWATLAKMPTGRQAAAAGVLDGKLYVTGGRSAAGELRTVEAYNPATNSWTAKAPLPATRAGLATGVAKNASGQPVLYAVGGLRGGAGVLATNQAYGMAVAPSADFRLSCEPTDAVIPQASAGTITCTVTSVNGFTGAVALSSDSAPTGVAIVPFAASVTVPANGSAKVPVSVNVAASVALGTYSFAFVGTSGTLHHAFTGQLTVSANTARVHVIYLIPSDKSYRADYALSTERAIRHLQIWYRSTLGTGRTFTLTNPVVAVYHTGHTSDWYNTNNAAANGGTTFWYNATGDGFALTGGGFYQPNDIWVFYIDADPAPGQAVGGAAGVALLPANDLRGLVGQTPEPVCRWVGGLGHELGHAFGLPHPPECDPVQTAECPTYALMWFGYTTYPSASLTSTDKGTLGQSAFFSPLAVTGDLFDCSSLAPTSLAAGRSTTTTGATRLAGSAPGALRCGYGQLRASLAQVLTSSP